MNSGPGKLCRDVDPSTGDTGPPTPRRPDKTYPRNRPPSNAHLSLPPTACTPLTHTCPARAQIQSQAHPLSGILVIHGLLGQPHPNTTTANFIPHPYLPSFPRHWRQATSFPSSSADSSLPPQILRAIPLIFIPSLFPKNVLIKM